MSNSPANLTAKPLGPALQLINQYGSKLFQPPNDSIRGITPDAWDSPLEPVIPIGPAGTEPRAFQYWSGQNLLYTPRPDAEYSAAALRSLATYPLARICLENVKDALCRAPWVIQLKRKAGETKAQNAKRAEGDENILQLTKFFERPDREHTWSDWLRPIIDDMLVIDAAAILVRKTFNGKVAELVRLQGEGITRYIDINGQTPIPPAPAYAQNWWGIPLVNLSMDQLIYKPRNIVSRNSISSQLYGMSPVEQLAPEITVGIKRLEFVTAYYTEGSIPGVVQVVPKGIPTDKIAEAMQWMNSDLAGNLAKRRQWRMVQGFNEPGKPDQIEFTKETLLSDPYDELHARRVAFGIGTSPQRLLKAMNRASAQQSDEAADIEGTLPYFDWLKRSVMDYIIQYTFGLPDYEWVPDPFKEPDLVKQAEALTKLVASTILTPNEGRKQLGEDEDASPEANCLGSQTANGFVSIGFATASAGMDVDPKGRPVKKELPEPQPTGAGGGANPPTKKPAAAAAADDGPKPKPKEKTNGHGAAERWSHCGDHSTFEAACIKCSRLIQEQFAVDVEKAKAEEKRKKAERPVRAIYPGRLHPRSVVAKHALEKILKDRFHTMEVKARKQLLKSLNKMAGGALAKATVEDETLNAILKQLAAEWLAIAEAAREPFEGAALAGADNGILQLDIDDEDMISEISENARAWAAERSAELVGMKRTKGGKLVVNPDAEMAISDTTRDQLRLIIRDLFDEGATSLTAVEERIMRAGTFSPERATVIAKTESARAQTQGNLGAWKASGVVKLVNWQLSADHDHDDECDENEDNSPYSIEDVPDLPAHPNCMCALVLSDADEERL